MSTGSRLKPAADAELGSAYAPAAAEPPAAAPGPTKGPAEVVLDAGEMAVVWDKGVPKAFGPQPTQITVTAAQSWTKLRNTKAALHQFLEVSKLDGSADHVSGPANR